MNRDVEVAYDAKREKIVMIHNICFKGKRGIDWEDVRRYLKGYTGDSYIIARTGEVVHMGKDLADEYTGSKYTRAMRGANAKAKANAAQGLPEMIEIATGGHFRINTSDKHSKDAAQGWYRYDSRFAVPVYYENGKIERYNAFHASMLVRHDRNGKKYLYDVIDIKKETSNPFEQ